MSELDHSDVVPVDDDSAPQVYDVGTAFIGHAADVLMEEVDPAAIDRSASFLGDHPIAIGSRLLDSLDLVHLFAAVDEELGVAVLDVDDVQEVDSLDKVSRHLLAHADPARLRAYCERWTATGS
jgi:hypothetical protein